jgi:6-pyruvoyltetrahydropterin/6-carboxytetrahydropterin synthase
VTVGGPLGPDGIVVDFSDLREVVEREVIARYDHRYLNDLMDNPTAELLAQEIWKSLEAAGLAVVGVRLWETADSMVEVTST